MRNKFDVLISAAAGAVGGGLVAMLLVNNLAAVPTQTINTEAERNTAIDQNLSYEEAVVRAVELANPAVVSIVITRDVPIIERFYEDAPNSISPFDDFYNRRRLQVPQYRQRGTQKQEVGGGSGFLVTTDGLVLTNRHVVDEDDVDYTVFLNDGTKFDATVVARDPIHDLAVIKIEGSGLPFLAFAESDELKVGQSVIAIGNALAEFRNTVSVGVISGLSRSILAGGSQGIPEQLEEVLQTDAAINPGNSGGPLLNLDGKVVGVNVATALGSENIGFALPGKLVRGVVESVQQTGRIVRPYIGVRYVTITPALVEQNSLPVDYGILVIRGNTEEDLAVLTGSPANKAGIVEGDIILEADGVKINEKFSLSAAIRVKQIGDSITLKILSGEEEKTLTLTLEELPQ